MVKGISKQVIVVNSPDRNMFDQAIFILSDRAVKGEGVTDEMLMREARMLMQKPKKKRDFFRSCGMLLLGAASISLIWLLTVLL